jgi:hypothetical protein
MQSAYLRYVGIQEIYNVKGWLCGVLWEGQRQEMTEIILAE